MKIVSYNPSRDPVFKKFIKEIEKESERGQAVICHAYIEDLLKECLKKRLIEDEGFLNSLKSSISFKRLLTLCFITGIVTEEERQEIELLAKIRNKFAHNREINSFGIAGIPDICNKLRTPRSFTSVLTPQKKYIMAAAYYIQTLNLKLKYTKKVRLVEDESPDLKMLATLYV